MVRHATYANSSRCQAASASSVADSRGRLRKSQLGWRRDEDWEVGAIDITRRAIEPATNDRSGGLTPNDVLPKDWHTGGTG